MQIPSYGFIARHLKAKLGAQTELWVLGEPARSIGRDHDGFDQVVDLLNNASLDEISQSDHRRHLQWFRDLEEQFGRRFYHRDVAMDRCFQQTRLNRRDIIDVEWTTQRVAAAMFTIGRSIDRRFGDDSFAGVITETNSAPKRLAWRLAQARGIDSVQFLPTRHWPDRGYIEDGLGFTWQSCRNTYEQFQAQTVPKDLQDRASERLEEITGQELKASSFQDYSTDASLWERVQPGRLIDSQRRWISSHDPEQRRNPNVPPPDVLSPVSKLRRYRSTAKSRKIYRRYFERAPALPESFAVYFLHIQPEATVETMAFEYQDQVATLRNLVSYLPADMPLLVKEHSPIAGDRPVEFYSELAHLPNIQLIHHSVHSHRLIREASVILTLTGTVGLEALYYGKPAVVLGDVFFRKFRGITHPNSLPEARKMLHEPSQIAVGSRDDAIRSLASTYSASSPGIYPPRPDQQPDTSKAMADAFVGHFETGNDE